MPIAAGTPAPPFSLPVAGGGVATLATLLDDGARSGLLAFFKGSCPVCQMSFPVYGRLAEAVGDRAGVAAVSQDADRLAQPWLADRGFAAPALVDEADGRYEVSDLYGIRSVPTLVLIDPDGTVAKVAEGWDRDAANEIAAALGVAQPVSTPADGLPPFKPG